MLGVFDDGSILSRERPIFGPRPGTSTPHTGAGIPKEVRDVLKAEIVYRRGMPAGSTLVDYVSMMAADTEPDGHRASAHGQEISAVFGSSFLWAPADTPRRRYRREERLRRCSMHAN